MLEERYEHTQGQDPDDDNHYKIGRIVKHNVVIASLPSGRTGTESAATVANQLIRSFKSIRIRLMVGIGGRVPKPDIDLRLSDVVVSQPHDCFGGVVSMIVAREPLAESFSGKGN